MAARLVLKVRLGPALRSGSPCRSRPRRRLALHERIAIVTTTLRATVERLFKALEAKDAPAVLAFFAPNATIVDPHYPVPSMQGKAAIADGLRWAFGALRSMGFTIVNYCESADGRHAAVEVA